MGTVRSESARAQTRRWNVAKRALDEGNPHPMLHLVEIGELPPDAPILRTAWNLLWVQEGDDETQWSEQYGNLHSHGTLVR